jgi:zinc protease
MKKFIYSLMVVALAAGAGYAQNPKQAYELMVDGVKVIVQPSGNSIVEIQTIIKGGVQNYTAEKMGIESMAMTALTECGTVNHDKNSFKNQLDKVNASMYGSAGKNFSVLRMNCIKSDFDTVWPLYAEALTQPVFDAKEFARIQQDAINNLKQSESDPDMAIDNYADKVAFAGRSYAENPGGTVDIIQKFTPEEVKAYYDRLLTRSRMAIVIVADLDKTVIESKLKALLDGIKPGSPFEFKKSFFRAYQNTFSADPRDLATNYVEGVTSGPEAGSSDYDAFQVAMRIFADRHFLDVRTNNGLSYAPEAWFSAGAMSVAKFSVSTTQPDKYIAVFDTLVDKVKTEGFKAGEVANMKTMYLTGFYYKNETNSDQASSIAMNEVVYGDWKHSLELIRDIKKLTPEQVSDAFRKYIGNIIWVYQGDPKKVNPLLYTNGTLHKADNPVSN